MGDPNFNNPMFNKGKMKNGPKATPVRDANRARNAARLAAKVALKPPGKKNFAAPGVGGPRITPMPGEGRGGMDRPNTKFPPKPGFKEGNTGVVGPMPKPPTPKPFTKPMVRPEQPDSGFAKPMKSHRAPWRQ